MPRKSWIEFMGDVLKGLVIAAGIFLVEARCSSHVNKFLNMLSTASNCVKRVVSPVVSRFLNELSKASNTLTNRISNGMSIVRDRLGAFRKQSKGNVSAASDRRESLSNHGPDERNNRSNAPDLPSPGSQP